MEPRWLVVWKSMAHNHKALFYTPDGQLFKTWTGPLIHTEKERDCPRWWHVANLGPLATPQSGI